MKIISLYTGPPQPPGLLHAKEYSNKERRIPVDTPIYDQRVVEQRLTTTKRVYLSEDMAYELFEEFGFESKDITDIMLENFRQPNIKAFYVNSSWCGYLNAWAASDAYILNPYEQDSLLLRKNKREDYYCKFFISNGNVILNAISFHEVRDEYNGVKYV